MPPPEPTLRVGELARRTGLTVRALHHYDAVGLVRPSAWTDAGHRRYSAADAARLQQVVSLRALGLSLEAIRDLLDGGDAHPLGVVERHLAHLRAEIRKKEQLVTHLEWVAERHRAGGGVTLDEVLHTIHLTTMFEKHYTPEQLAQLEQRRALVGEERIRQVQQEWADLFAEARRHMDAGTPPEDPALAPLARRAEALIGEFTGGDAGIRRSLTNAVQADQKAMYAAWGIGEALGDFYGRVMQAHGGTR